MVLYFTREYLHNKNVILLSVVYVMVYSWYGMVSLILCYAWWLIIFQ